MYAGIPDLFGLQLEDSHVPTFWLLLPGLRFQTPYRKVYACEWQKRRKVALGLVSKIRIQVLQ